MISTNSENSALTDAMRQLEELTSSPVWALLEAIQEERRQRDAEFAKHTRRRAKATPLSQWEDELSLRCYLACETAQLKRRTLRLLGMEES